MKKERSKSKQRYYLLYLRWRVSGKGVRVFCEQESIKYSTFRDWIKQFETNIVTRHGFIEMKVDKVEVKCFQLLAELRPTDRGTLIFYELREPAWVKSVAGLTNVIFIVADMLLLILPPCGCALQNLFAGRLGAEWFKAESVIRRRFCIPGYAG